MNEHIESKIKRIDKFCKVEPKNTIGGEYLSSISIVISKTPTSSNKSINVSVRTEDELYSILQGLGFEDNLIKPKINEFNGLRKNTESKGVERFIIATNEHK